MADPVAEELGKGVTLVGLARARSPVNLDQSPSGGWLPAKATFPVGSMIPALLVSTTQARSGPAAWLGGKAPIPGRAAENIPRNRPGEDRRRREVDE